jgi:hypothetical protein
MMTSAVLLGLTGLKFNYLCESAGGSAQPLRSRSLGGQRPGEADRQRNRLDRFHRRRIFER